MCRFIIGRTRLIHSFILKQEQKSWCIVCQTPYTVKLFFSQNAKIYFSFDNVFFFFKTNNIKNLSEIVNVDDILSF